MKIVDGYLGLDPSDRGASVAIGNFDGVHVGHQILLADARARGGLSGVVTFAPHPRRLFQPDAPPFRLTTDTEKARLIAGHGADRLYCIPFDRALAGMAASDFVRKVLCEGLRISHLVAGADFRFGKGRTGDATLLRQMGHELGFGVTIHDLVGDETGDYASTAIRVLVAEGRCGEAAHQLGRWHTVSGIVQKGDQRGRGLGYPTANLAFEEQILPRFGIYAAEVTVHDGPYAGTYSGVASIGERPTFGINAPNFEVHLFDFNGDLYGAEISAGLVAYLRGEERFDSIDALIAQMDRDSARARDVLATAKVPG